MFSHPLSENTHEHGWFHYSHRSFFYVDIGRTNPYKRRKGLSTRKTTQFGVISGVRPFTLSVPVEGGSNALLARSRPHP
jgi:hypothetical protein